MSAAAIVGQAPTILGPLTTVFTAPAACTTAIGQTNGGLLGLGLLGGGPVGNFAFLGQTCNAGQPADATACWPPVTSGAPAAPTALRGWGVYSPGLDCPAGYSTACSATAGGSSGWPVQFNLQAGETAIGCCPSGFGCANINGQTCIMSATSTIISTATCDGNRVGALGARTIPDVAASMTAFSLFAPMIQINFQSTDLPATTGAQPGTSAGGVIVVPVPTSTGVVKPGPGQTVSTMSTSPTSSTQETGTSSNRQTTASAEEPDPAAPSSGTANTSLNPSPSTAADLQSPNTDNSSSAGTFPRMAAIGIGVGGGAAVLLIGGSALLYCWRRRRSARREEEELDRLYGLGKLDSVTGLSRADEFPGFPVYRGQRPTETGRSGAVNF